MNKNYRQTLAACYLGLVTQAITANFAPLLFLKFHGDYGISLGRIALIPGTFFVTQLIVDVLCARFADRIGYRRCAVASEVCSAVGLAGLIGAVCYKRPGILAPLIVCCLPCVAYAVLYLLFD